MKSIIKSLLLVCFTSLSLSVIAQSSGETLTRTLVNNAVGKNSTVRSLPPGKNKGLELSASDFGFSTSATPDQNAKALENLGRALTEKKASAVRFESGDYAVQLGFGKPAFLLEGLTDFTVKGNGARILFRDTKIKGKSACYLTVKNCTRLLISDISLVWDWDDKPLAVEGRITEVGADFLRYEVVSGGVLQQGYKITGGREWDIASSSRSPKGYGAGHFSGGDAEIIDEKNFVFKGVPAGRPQVGMATMLAVEPNWHGFGVKLEGENDHLTFDHFQLRGVPATALSGRSKHLWIHHSVLAPPRTGLFKACHDGFMSSSANYVFENNEVDFCHDDVMNFRGGRLGSFLGGGVLVDGSHSLIADRLQRNASMGSIIKGAKCYLATRDFKPLSWSSHIKSFEWQFSYYPVDGKIPVDRCRIIFEDSVPSLLGYGNKDLFIMIDEENSGGYIISNNTFKNNLCHGIWAGEGPGLIENNQFLRTGYPAIGVLMTLRWGRWYHGFYPEGLIIRNNELENCNAVMRQPADIYVGASIDDPGSFLPVQYAVVKNVIIENNKISNSSQASIGVFSAENVVVRNNQISSPGRLPLVKEAISDAAIFGMYVNSMELLKNQIKGEDGSVHGVKLTQCENVVEKR